VKRTLVVLGLLLVPAPARADEIDNCANSYEATQRLRQRGELRAARSAAGVCARDVCPAVLRKDCTTWVRELADTIPSVRVRARGPGGCVVPDVVVRVDQTTAGDASLEVDPGGHVVSATTKTGQRVEKTITVSIGDRDRPIDLALDSCGVTETPPPSRPEPPSRGIPTISLALAATGAVAIGLATWQGLRGLYIKNQLEERQCEPHCLHSDVVHAKTAFVAADVLGTIGIVAIAAAAYFWLVPDSGKTRAMRIGPGYGTF